MKKIYLVLLLGTFVFAREETVPRSNGMVVDSLLLNVFDSVLVESCDGDSGAWAFEATVPAEKKQLLQSAFHAFLARRKGTVRPRALRQLQVELFDIDIVYVEDSFRGGWDSEWSRVIQVRLRGSFHCVAGDTVIYPFDRTLTWRDTVRQENLQSIEAEGYPSLKGRHSSYNVWSQWIEPALVTISLSAVVYLFFTIRS